MFDLPSTTTALAMEPDNAALCVDVTATPLDGERRYAGRFA
jgi:hypothetical protein